MNMTKRTLHWEAAFDLFAKRGEIDYTVDDKFTKDHILPNDLLSKRAAIEGAIARYKKNKKINLSSWIITNPQTLINNAGSGKWKRVPIIHQGQQQLSTEFMVVRKRVTIERAEDSLRTRQIKDAQIDHHRHERDSLKKYYFYPRVEEHNMIIRLVGAWNPVLREAKIYHYEEAAISARTIGIVDRYCNWWFNGEIITEPVAEK